MSDRQSTVRTQDAARAGEAGTSVSTTQAIPTSGSTRAQAGAAGAPAVPATGTVPAAPAAGTGAAPAAGTGAAPAAGAGAAPVAPATSVAAGAAVAGAAAASAQAKKTQAKKTQASRPGRPGKAAGRGPRRARLQLRHVDIWSAFKISLVLSIALFFIWMVAVGILYGVLSGLGVFKTLNDLFGQLGDASGSGGGGDVITPGIVISGAAVIGAINVILMTALCTVGTFIYNLCSDLVGGLELTLSERD